MQLEEEMFDKLFHSPLKRAAETASIVWGNNDGPTAILPSLREIDLYSFQGLLKDEGIAKFGKEFRTWQTDPSNFEIDGCKPVVELWYRASLAWRDILLDTDVHRCALVVAHNAVNQALVATAVGLQPTFFRRLLQSNAASTVLDFVPKGPDQPPVVTIDRLNQVCPPFVLDASVWLHIRTKLLNEHLLNVAHASACL
jgi:2-carboxy-D-arabinitol-1-phosphatase